MKMRSLVLATIIGLPLAMAAESQAATIQGSSAGTFTSLSGCDNSGGDQNCRIVNSSTQVQWGSDSSYNNFYNPSTLTANNVAIGPVSTNANDVKIAKLTWFNSSTLSSETPNNFSFIWNLTVSFTLPNVTSDGEAFNLNVTNTTNPPGDLTAGFTLGDLAGLVFNLTGVTVTDLKYLVEGGTLTNGTWFNSEDNTSVLYITADFIANTPVSVPEPASLAMLGMGLLGAGMFGRRKIRA